MVSPGDSDSTTLIQGDPFLQLVRAFDDTDAQIRKARRTWHAEQSLGSEAFGADGGARYATEVVDFLYQRQETIHEVIGHWGTVLNDWYASEMGTDEDVAADFADS